MNRPPARTRVEYRFFQQVQERLRLDREQTVLLISHRFANVRLADRIYVLEAGRVAECGTHDQLVAHGGLYAELFRVQAAGYQ